MKQTHLTELGIANDRIQSGSSVIVVVCVFKNFTTIQKNTIEFLLTTQDRTLKSTHKSLTFKTIDISNFDSLTNKLQ